MALTHLLQRSPSIVAGVQKAKTVRQLGVTDAEEQESTSPFPSALSQVANNVDSSAKLLAKLKSRTPGNNVKRSRRREEEELLLCFKVMDEDGDGCLSVDDLHDAYQHAGADVSRATLANLVKLLRKSQAGKGDKSQGAGASEETDETDFDSRLTFNDFKALTKLRKEAKWDDNNVPGEQKLASIRDLPIPISLVALSQRRKIILRNYLMDDFEIPDRFLTEVDQTRMAANHAGTVGLGNGSIPISSLEEADDSTLQQHALSLLPPSMQRKAVHELSMIPDKIQNQRRYVHRPPAAQPPLSHQQHSSGPVSPPRRIRGPSPFEVRHGLNGSQAQQPLDYGNHGAESPHIFWNSADSVPRSSVSGPPQYNEGPFAVRRQETSGDRHLGTSVAKVSPASPMLPPSSPVRLSRHRRWLPSSPRFQSRCARSLSGIPSLSHSLGGQEPLTDYFSSMLVQGPIIAHHSNPATPTPVMLLSSAPNYLAASYQPRPSRTTPAASSIRGSDDQSGNQSRKQKVRIAQDAAKAANRKAIMKGWRSRSLSSW